jgi:hypothetical protein
MSDEAWPDPIWVLDALDRLGLRYQQRTTAHGVPYAGMSLGEQGRETSALTVLAEDGTLRVTAHDVLARPDGVRRAGRRHAGRSGVALGCLVGAAPLLAEELDRLLQHAAASALWVRDGGAPPALPPFHAPAVTGVWPVPEVPGCRLAVVVERSGWITATAAGVPAATIGQHPDGVAVLHRLQLWTRAGRYVELREGDLGVEVRTPVRDDDLAIRIEWTRAQATLMVEVARRHLARPAG